jgi:hypothetical protein
VPARRVPPILAGLAMSQISDIASTPRPRRRIMRRNATTLGDAMPSYKDVQSAVRVEKFRIWFAWFCGGLIALLVAEATKDIHIVSTIVQVVLALAGIAFTITAMRMTNGLNEKADAARREVLGDDYPG